MIPPSKDTPERNAGPKWWDWFAGAWLLAAMLLAVLAAIWLQGAFPVFTVLMLMVVLAVLLRGRSAERIGMGPAPWQQVAKYALISLGGQLALMAAFEPWSHTYQTLLQLALAGSAPDTTFGWLERYPGIGGWLVFFAYASTVTLFAEEVFFRGWLLKWLMARMGAWQAVATQAVLFSLPQLLAALLLPPLQGGLYAIIYSWLAIGLIGGWAASRTGSIWPSLIAAALYNLIMSLWVLA